MANQMNRQLVQVISLSIHCQISIQLPSDRLFPVSSLKGTFVDWSTIEQFSGVVPGQTVQIASIGASAGL
jgi:hypothetical protein